MLCGLSLLQLPEIIHALDVHYLVNSLMSDNTVELYVQSKKIGLDWRARDFICFGG